MKRILYAVLFCVLLSGGQAFAQQQPHFTHYGFNGMYLSPGYSGITGATEFSMIFRNQWYSYDATLGDKGGSPKTGLFSVSIPVQALRGGLGVNIAYDQIAETKVTMGQLSYAFHIPVGTGKLGIGAQGGVTNFAVGKDYRPIDEDDPKIPVGSSDTRVDAGAGIWYHSDGLYGGVGLNNLLGSKYEFENNGTKSGEIKDKTTITAQKHLYATVGYNIDASETLEITPMALVKYDFGSDPSYEGGIRATFSELFYVGVNYRHQDAVSALLGANLLKGKALRVGLAYDFTTGGEEAKAPGSYEIMLQYRIPTNPAPKPAIRTPRYSF